jgi:hypothetical protein
MNVGDSVQWTHVRHMGTTIKFFAMEGKILEIKGNLAVIKRAGSGRKYEVPLKRLRTMDQRNELTEWVMGDEPPKG